MSIATEHARFTIDRDVATLTFDRPEARHAMTWDMYQALVTACDLVDAAVDATEAAEAGTEVTPLRVFVIRSTGDKAFISGTDISQFTHFDAPDAHIQYERRMDAIIDRLERVRIPTIAQVQGVAAGGGCMIALACDMRVCATEARFGVPVARTLGNCLSAANYARLVDLIGPARTKDIMFTGRFLTATEAESLGLANRLVQQAELEAATKALAETVAAHAPLTLRATKEAVRRVLEHRRLGTAAADDLVTLCYTSADFKEGVSAFLEKRPPAWTGR